MNLGLLFTVAAAGILIMSVLWALVFKKHAVLRLFCAAVRAVGAFIGTLILKSTVLSSAADIKALLTDLMGQELAVSEELMQIFGSLAMAFASVIIFTVLYFALGIVMFFVRIIFAIVLGKRKHAKFLTRVICGLAQGLIILTVLLVPISTYLSALDLAIPALSDASDTEMAEIEAPISELNSSAVVKAHRMIGGQLLSDSLTSIKLKTGDSELKTNLNDEIGAIVEVLGDLMPLTKTDAANYTDKEFTIMDNLGTTLTKSKFLSALMSELIVEADAAWSKGEAFMGVEKPSLGDTQLDPLLNKTLNIVAKDASNHEYLKEDINTFAKVITKILKTSQSQAPSDGGEGGAGNALLAEGMIGDVLSTINSNPRMRPLIPIITNIGLSMVADSLGVDADAAESYRKLNTAIANELKASAELTADERQTNMETAITNSLDDFGITDIGQSEVSIIAMSVISYFDSGEKPIAEITADDVAVFISTMVDTANGDGGGDGNLAVSAVTRPAEKAANLLADISQIQNNTALSVPEKEEAIENLIANSELFNTSELSPEKLGAIKTALMASAGSPNKAFGAIQKLTPNDENSIFKYTTKAILISDEVINSEISEEAANAMVTTVSAVFEKIAAISSEANGDGMAKSVFESLGMILDTFSQNEQLYGKEKSDLFLQTVLHAGGLTDGAMSTTDIESLLTARTDKNVSYTALLGTVYETFNTFSSINDGTSATPESIGALVDALANENSGAVIGTIITPDRLADMGFDTQTPEQLETSSEFLKTVFTNISAENEAERESEVAAINNLIGIVTEANKTEGTDTNAFGTDGRLGCEATELVDNILASNSVCTALNETELSNNPFGLTLTADDQTAAKSAINAKLADADTETANTLHSLALLLGVTL